MGIINPTRDLMARRKYWGGRKNAHACRDAAPKSERKVRFCLKIYTWSIHGPKLSYTVKFFSSFLNIDISKYAKTSSECKNARVISATRGHGKLRFSLNIIKMELHWSYFLKRNDENFDLKVVHYSAKQHTNVLISKIWDKYVYSTQTSDVCPRLLGHTFAGFCSSMPLSHAEIKTRFSYLYSALHSHQAGVCNYL